MKTTARSNGAARNAEPFIVGRRQATFQRVVMFERTKRARREAAQNANRQCILALSAQLDLLLAHCRRGIS